MEEKSNNKNYKRFYITFNLDFPTHQKAYNAYIEHGCKTDFIVNAINRFEDNITKSELIDLLKSIPIQTVNSNDVTINQENKEEIPDELFDFMDNEDW